MIGHGSTAGRFATVVQISDMHLAAARDESPASPDTTLQSTVNVVAGLYPDLVLLTGDIADDGSPQAYQRVAAIIESLRSPVLATPGNHDLAEGVRHQFGTETQASVGAWRVITIDTAIPGELHGQVDPDLLITQLGPDVGTPTLLAMHHPPITTSNHEWFQLHGGAELVAALARRGDVRLVVSGHLHEAFHAVSGGVTYIGCSSSWYSIKHRAAEYVLDNGHVGALAIDLYDDGTFEWRRIARP